MLSYFILGFFSLAAQVFVLKELSGLLTAHEAALGLGLSAWLLWTAAGLALALKNQALEKRLAGHKGFLTACACFALAVGANLILFRHTGFLLKPGLLPGLLELILYSFLLTLPAALANGLCIARGLSEKRLAFYRAETFGAAAGGLFTLLHAVLFPGADPLLIAGAAALALILSVPGIPLSSARKLAPAALAVVLFFCGSRFGPPFGLPGLFRNASATARTTGSRLALIESSSQKTFIEDGAVLIQLPLTDTAELSVQLPLLAHKKPEEILFTGPAGLFLAAEARKHKPKNITVADPDRFRTEFILARSGIKPEGVRLERADARALLKARPGAWGKPLLRCPPVAQSPGRGAWDLIFQTVPEPLNAAANRFFTVEFFRAAGAALKPGGLLAFTLPFSENYLPSERAYLAASILAGAGTAFKHVELAPGGTLMVLASDSPIDLSTETLARRYAQRKLSNRYAVPASFPFLLDPYRRQWALAMLAKAKKAPLDTDLDPVAYFYLWKMWLAMFVSPAALSGLALLAVAFVLLAARLLKPGELLADKDATGVFLAGFWAMGFSTVCLFMFQTHSGQLSWKLGTLFAAFMAGSAAGAYALKFASRSVTRAAALALSAALTAGLYVYAPDLGGLAPGRLFPVFLVLLFAGGCALGGYFAAAADTPDNKTGRLYYSDLLGAALGGFIFSAALIPLAGLRAALLWAAAALIPALLLAVHSSKRSTVKM